MNEHLEDLARLIHDADRRSFDGKLERLKILLEADKDDTPIPYSGLAYEYYLEARLCWYVGAYVATIVMSQLAFEEELRSHFRVSQGVNGKLSSGKKLDASGFSDLIEEAKMNGWLTEDDANALNRLRINYRNPYVHPHDSDRNLSKPDFIKLHVKLIAPGLIGDSIGEARECISLLTKLFPTIAHRFSGL